MNKDSIAIQKLANAVHKNIDAISSLRYALRAQQRQIEYLATRIEKLEA